MADRYWVGNGGNYTDFENHWAATSGGTPGTAGGVTAIPGSGDNVYFDGNSFNASGQTVVLLPDAVDRACLAFHCSGFTEANKPTFSLTGSNIFRVYGTMTLMSATYMTWTQGTGTFLEFTRTNTFNPQGHTFGTINHYLTAGNIMTLAGNLSCYQIYLGRGVFDTDGYNVTCTTNFSNTGTSVRSQILDGSVITVGRNLNFADTTNLTHSDVGTTYILTATPNTATLSNASTAGTPIKLNDVTFDAAGTYQFYLAGNCSFGKITVTSGSVLRPTSGITISIAEDSVIGDTDNTSTFRALTNDSIATISVASGKYLWAKNTSILDVVASGDGDAYYSDSSTVDAQSTGWTAGTPSTQKTGADSTILAVVDASGLAAAVSGGDSVILALADVASVQVEVVEISAGDGIVLLISEGTTELIAAISATDSLPVVIQDTHQLAVEISAQDTIVVAITESQTLAQIIPIVDSDSILLRLDDAATLETARAPPDQIPVTITDQASIAVNISSSDTLLVGMNDQAINEVDIAVADTIPVALSDDSTLDDGSYREIEADDSIIISVTDHRQLSYRGVAIYVSPLPSLAVGRLPGLTLESLPGLAINTMRGED